ncbi:MAG TPA: PorP/SprF family type IX secretion system membrane protein [Chitinophagaceae bacterium]
MKGLMINSGSTTTRVVAIFQLLLVCFSARAQDIHFSQFFEAPLLRNPSLAGIFTGDLRVQGVYRSQWGSVTVPYRTGSFDLEYKKPIGGADDFVTAGIQVLYDKAGTTNFTTTNVMPALNYHKALSADHNRYLSLGFMAGWVQRRIDMSKMTTNNQYDGNGYNPSLGHGETFTNSNFSYFDASVGMSYNSAIKESETDNYFIGVAYHHFNRPKNSFYKNPEIELHPKWVASAGVRFNINETSLFTVQGDYTKQGSFQQAIMGALYSYKLGDDFENPAYIVHFGAFLRWKDAFIPVIKLDFVPFSIGLSYDVNVSQLRTASQGRGGFELSVSYRTFFDRENSTKNAIRCPRF